MIASAVASSEAMIPGTYYAVLGIPETATQDEINRAYLNLTEAHRVLSNSSQRLSYDQQLAQQRSYSSARGTRNLPLAGEPIFSWWINWGALAGFLFSVAAWYMILR
jgi:DnaJ-class molecular chaperone